ncbi:thioesterase domain-containing protein, partial [Nonomuraea sp. LPB2021202275-12-8]|uniref:thioesterase domain-containing protein n=1 Tax=Nonomuraea sp. LPB2021202275-12-8 TaxID=3120159 RepID=UPI00300CD7FC
AQDPLDMLIPLRSGGSRAPVFCVHPVGGLSWSYSGLLRHIDRERPLYALQARGLRDGGELPESIPEMAAEYIELIQRIQPSGPYNLAGWSFGGLVVHEMATQLQNNGEEISLLTLFDSYPMLEEEDDLGVAEAKEILADLIGQNSGLEPLSGFEGDIVANMVAVVRNNARLMSGFVPGKFLGDALLFVAERTWDMRRSASAEWDSYVSGQVFAHPVDATHDDLMRPESIAEIGPRVADRLREINEHRK